MKFFPLILVLLTGCKAMNSLVFHPIHKVWQIHEANEQYSAADVPAPLVVQPRTVTVSWDYPVGTDILGFHLYSSTECKQLPWPLYTTIEPELREVKLTNDAPQRFFALTAFNAAGESGYATTGP